MTPGPRQQAGDQHAGWITPRMSRMSRVHVLVHTPPISHFPHIGSLSSGIPPWPSAEYPD